MTRLTCAGPAALTTRRVRPRSWQVPTTGSSNRARGGNWMSHVWMPWMRHKSAAGAPRMPPSKARAAPLARIGSRPKIARNLSTHRKGTEADGATPPATPRRERNTAPPTQLARTAPAAGPAAGGGRAPARARGGFQEERGDGVRIGPDRAVRCRRPTWDKFGWRERGRKLLTSRKCGCGWWQVACYQLSAVVVLSYFAVAIARSKLHHLGKRVTEELVLDALWSTLGI